MTNSDLHTCFLLNYSSRDVGNHFEISLYAIDSKKKNVKIIVDNFRPLFFVPQHTPRELTTKASERKELLLKAIDGTPVDCLYFQKHTLFQTCREELESKNVALYESDIHPVERFLMERFVAGGFEVKGTFSERNGTLFFHNPIIRGCDVQPAFQVLSFDIETCVETNQIYSIACSGKQDIVFITGNDTSSKSVQYHTNEKEMLNAFFNHILMEDPDILIGWNVIDFDLKMIQNRCAVHSIPFNIGRDPGARILESKTNQNSIARIPGRAVMDLPTMLRANFFTFEEYSLNFVASAMLNKTKIIETTGEEKIAEINRLFKEDKPSLANYNLQDAILTREIFEKAGLLQNAIERSKRSGLLIDRTGGSIAAFDYLYLPRLHRLGYVARNMRNDSYSSEPLPGGFVLEPKPGIYENVIVFDFRSLYPSLIMTFKIDPLGYVIPSENKVSNPAGTSFAADTTILPGIIEQLLIARSIAKQENNPYLSQAIKILMNSFYGVLGAQSCRFFSFDLASTITRTGQFILKQTIEYISNTIGYPVIYGDTDSLFVLLGKGKESRADEIGNALSKQITHWLNAFLKLKYNVTSSLQLEYQDHFRHFLMPSVRGASHGSKKHYCGSVIEKGEIKLVFKGMESARSDWTDIAKEFQNELIMKVFADEPVEKYVMSITAKVKNGELDNKLIYKKRLRKDLQDYTVHVPPHVQAARLLKSPKHLIRYVITVNGPQPIESVTAPIDYNHYVDNQLKPVADSILEWIGTSFDTIVSGQQDLFSSLEV